MQNVNDCGWKHIGILERAILFRGLPMVCIVSVSCMVDYALLPYLYDLGVIYISEKEAIVARIKLPRYLYTSLSETDENEDNYKTTGR
jgi:hypothetical protein